MRSFEPSSTAKTFVGVAEDLLEDRFEVGFFIVRPGWRSGCAWTAPNRRRMARSIPNLRQIHSDCKKSTLPF